MDRRNFFKFLGAGVAVSAVDAEFRDKLLADQTKDKNPEEPKLEIPLELLKAAAKIKAQINDSESVRLVEEIKKKTLDHNLPYEFDDFYGSAIIRLRMIDNLNDERKSALDRYRRGDLKILDQIKNIDANLLSEYKNLLAIYKKYYNEENITEQKSAMPAHKVDVYDFDMHPVVKTEDVRNWETLLPNNFLRGIKYVEFVDQENVAAAVNHKGLMTFYRTRYPMQLSEYFFIFTHESAHDMTPESAIGLMVKERFQFYTELIDLLHSASEKDPYIYEELAKHIDLSQGNSARASLERTQLKEFFPELVSKFFERLLPAGQKVLDSNWKLGQKGELFVKKWLGKQGILAK